MEKLGNQIAKDMQKAITKEQDDIKDIAISYQKASNKILKDYGCDASCIDKCTASPEVFY